MSMATKLSERAQVVQQWLDTVRSELDLRALQAGAQWLYWIEVDGQDDDEDYCLPCAKKEAATKPGAEVEGGPNYPESDYCRSCEKCGQLLHYVLTNHGAQRELEHYQQHGWDWDDPDDCYHIAAMLGAWIGDGWFDPAGVPAAGLALLHAGKHLPEILGGQDTDAET